MAAKEPPFSLPSTITLPNMSPYASSGFGIRAFDSIIRVTSSNDAIRNLLNLYTFPPLSRSDFTPDLPDIDLGVEESSDGFEVLLNGKLASVEASPLDAVLVAVKALDEAVVHNLKTYRAVHAGAVLLQSGALLIPGGTHAGKSSLVAELLRHGASCLSDEYAMIGEDGLVHAYPRPLLIRNGRPQQSLVLPQELRSTYAHDSAPVKWIVAVDYKPENDWRVHQVPQSEAVMLLLRNTPHEMSQSPGLVDFFVRVATDAVCYQGCRGDATQAVVNILHLLRR